MKKVFTGADPVLVGHIRSILEAEGIEIFVKNEHLSGGIGELPAIECWPELWVKEDRDADRAELLIQEVRAQSGVESTSSTWTCPACGEVLEAQFTECWRCSDSSLLA